MHILRKYANLKLRERAFLAVVHPKCSDAVKLSSVAEIIFYIKLQPRLSVCFMLLSSSKTFEM
jgi:hypothetical protein